MKPRVDRSDLLDKWWGWLMGTDCNSIASQISTLEADYSYFSLIVLAIKMSPTDAVGKKCLNAYLFDSIVRTYFMGLSILVRKQLLQGGDESTLRVLLEELACNLRNLPLVTLTGFLKSRRSDLGQHFDVQGYSDSIQLVLTRCPFDGELQLHPRFHRNLLKLLSHCGRIERHATAFYAHAITREERKAKFTEHITTTLGEIKQAIKLLGTVYRCLRWVLFNNTLVVQPVQPLDHLFYLDQPLLQSSTVSYAKSAMEAAYDELQVCTDRALELLRFGFESTDIVASILSES